MPRRSRPQVGFFETDGSCWECFLEEDACKVKTATPAVTARTTRYLYRGKERLKRVMWRNITGRSLQDLARMKVM